MVSVVVCEESIKLSIVQMPLGLWLQTRNAIGTSRLPIPAAKPGEWRVVAQMTPEPEAAHKLDAPFLGAFLFLRQGGNLN